MASSSVIMKSSNVFFLAIVLLVCSSYANDDIPQVTSSVHRKLSWLPSAKFVNDIDKMISKDTQLPDTQLPELAKIPNDKPKLLNDHSTPIDMISSTLSGNNVYKKEAEDTVEKYFGAEAKRCFRLGWSLGKRYYSVNNKCENYKNILPKQCTKTPECSPQSVPCSCVLEIVEGTSSSNPTTNCYEKYGVLQETPYSPAAVHGLLFGLKSPAVVRGLFSGPKPYCQSLAGVGGLSGVTFITYRDAIYKSIWSP